MMNRLVAGGIALIALTVSGWSSAAALNVPELCGGFDILNDPENRVYRGKSRVTTSLSKPPWSLPPSLATATQLYSTSGGYNHNGKFPKPGADLEQVQRRRIR